MTKYIFTDGETIRGRSMDNQNALRAEFEHKRIALLKSAEAIARIAPWLLKGEAKAIADAMSGIHQHSLLVDFDHRRLAMLAAVQAVAHVAPPLLEGEAEAIANALRCILATADLGSQE